MAVTRLVKMEKKILRSRKGEDRDKRLTDFRDQEFLMRRQVHQTSPDTPRKVKLKSQLQEERRAHRAVKRKLSAAEKTEKDKCKTRIHPLKKC